jgi:hypothetical protein
VDAAQLIPLIAAGVAALGRLGRLIVGAWRLSSKLTRTLDRIDGMSASIKKRLGNGEGDESLNATAWLGWSAREFRSA